MPAQNWSKTMARSIFVARSILAAGLFVGACGWAAVAIADDVRAWKSEDGKFSLNAEFVASNADIVQLKRADTGKVVDVPISKLSKADLQYIQLRTTTPGPTESSPPATEFDSSTLGMPGPADVGIQMIDDSQYHLIPFGKIGVPKEKMFWKISARSPVVFLAQGQPTDGVVVLTVLPKCENQDERVASIKSIYNGLVSQLQAGEFRQLRGEKPDIKTEIADQVDFEISALAPDGSEMHFLTQTRFSQTYSFVFQATSGSLEDSQSLLKVAETFVADEAKVVEPLPESLVDELTQATQSLIAKLESGDSDAVLKYLIPPDLYESLHADPQQWKEIVDGFEKIDGPALVSKLKGLDISVGQWDSEKQTVQYLIAPRPLTFQKVDGVWRLQN
jgi:SLA1 homology domain 1, SHD1